VKRYSQYFARYCLLYQQVLWCFPKGYILVGTQAEQKKYIGNAVEVNMSKVLCEAICDRLMQKSIAI